MKKLLVALLGVGIVFSTMLGGSVSASDLDTKADENGIEIRYEEINHIIADISIENGSVISSGSYYVRLENPKIKLEIIVQESTNGKDWKDVKSERFTGSTQMGDATVLYKAVDRHFYRTKVILDVYDSNGTYIESGDVCSNTKAYFE